MVCDIGLWSFEYVIINFSCYDEQKQDDKWMFLLHVSWFVWQKQLVKFIFLHEVQHIFTSYEGNMYMCVDKETNPFLLCKEN